MKLNEDGVQSPKQSLGNTVKFMETPDFFQKEIDKNSEAKTFYKGLSQIKKNEYIRYVSLSNVEATRDANVVKAIGWMEEGKERNWNKGNGKRGNFKKSKA